MSELFAKAQQTTQVRPFCVLRVHNNLLCLIYWFNFFASSGAARILSNLRASGTSLSFNPLIYFQNEKGNLEIHSSDAGGDIDRDSDYPRSGKLYVSN